jgi:hypothetical protein
MNPKNFFGELRRRNVYKVAIAYAVIVWLLIQAGSVLFPTFEASGWVDTPDTRTSSNVYSCVIGVWRDVTRQTLES